MVFLKEFNSAYNKRNRKDAQTFKCEIFWHKANTQINSAKSILRRVSLLEMLVKRHIERLKGCNSTALEVLRDLLNPITN